MNKVFIFIFLTFNVVFSQKNSTLKIYESKEYPNKAKEDSIQSAHTFKNGNTGILRIRKKEILVDIFNHQLEKKESLSIEKNRKEAYIGDIIYNDEFRVFTESYPERDTRVIHCYRFNTSSKQKEKKEISKSKIDLKLIFHSNKKYTSTITSLDYFSVVSYVIHAREIYFDINVFDSKNFKLIYNKKFKRKENKKYTVSDVVISNDKDIFILGKSFYNDENPDITNFKKSYYLIDKISSSDVRETRINPSDKYMKSLKLFLSQESINIYGFYSEKKIDQIKGICNFSINKESLEIDNNFFEKLPAKIYDDIQGVKKSRKTKELKNFSLNYIIKDKEDSIYLLAEEFYTVSQGGTMGINGGMQSGGFTTTIYGDIITVKISKEGKIEWGRSILKKDTKNNYNAFLDKENNLHILLNSGKNLSSKKDGRIKVIKKVFESSSLYDISFNSKDGTNNYQKIQNNKNRTYYMPKYGNYINGKFIMPNQSKRNLKLMSIE